MSREGARREILAPAAVFAAATLLHWLEGRFVRGPWLLPEELRSADPARTLAAAGRGGSSTLYSAVTAPLWLGSTSTGYALTKLLGAVAVSATAFPAYRLARQEAGPRWALAAAALAVVVPASLYASAVLPAALAYPVVTWGAVVAVRFLEAPAWRTAVGAVALMAVASALWPLLLWLAVPLLLLVLGRALGRRLLAWPGLLLLAALPAGVYAAYYLARGLSPVFAAGTSDAGSAALAAVASLGAFALGLGLLPLGGVLRRSWLGVAAATATIALAVGAGIAAAGASRRTDETLLLAATPLVAAAAAGAAERRRLSPVLAVAAVVLAAAASFAAPGAGTFRPEAPALALARLLHVSAPGLALALLVGAAVVVGAVLLGLGPRRGRTAATIGIASLVLVVAGAGEITAANDAADAAPRRVALPDQNIGLLPTPQTDGRTLDSVLFWNPRTVVVEPTLEQRTVDPATGQPDPPFTPNGLLFDFGGKRLEGQVEQATPVGDLVQVGSPARLAETVEGLYPDGWSGAHAVYRRFDTPTPGHVDVTVSRAGWGGPDVPGGVTVSLGDPGGAATAVRRLDVHPGQTFHESFAVPAKPFQVAVDSQTFSPSSFGQADKRQLGAQLTFAYRPG